MSMLPILQVLHTKDHFVKVEFATISQYGNAARQTRYLPALVLDILFTSGAKKEGINDR